MSPERAVSFERASNSHPEITCFELFCHADGVCQVILSILQAYSYSATGRLRL